MRRRLDRFLLLAAILLSLACGDGAATSPSPSTSTSTSTSSGVPPAEATSTEVRPNEAPTTSGAVTSVGSGTEQGVIDLRDIGEPFREPSVVRAEFGIGDGPFDLGVEVPNESAGRGPSNPALLSDGTVAIVDQVNERFVTVPPDGAPNMSTPEGTVWADCIRTGPRDVVYTATGGSPGGGISAFVVDNTDTTRVAGPSGAGLAASPNMGSPAEVPAFTSTEAQASGTRPLALVGRDGAPLAGAGDEVPDSVVGGTASDGTTTFTRVDIGGAVIGRWTVRPPRAADSEPVAPVVVWLAPIGEDGIAVAWVVEVGNGPAFAVARLGRSGPIDVFTIPATWQFEGMSCTNPVGDEERLVALVPVRDSAEIGRTQAFRLLEWEWG